MSFTVVCADGDDEVRATTSDHLDRAGYEVREAATVQAATAALADGGVDCVVTDSRLPDGDGLDVVDAVRSEAPDTPCILFTDAAPSEIDTAAFGGLVVEYLRTDREGAHERLRALIDDLVSHRTQVGYPLPRDEDARLTALEQYDVEDADVQATFDRLTELAAHHFDVDKVFVGVVDEHEERFVACQGGRLDPLEREKTMCTHAILSETVMVVEDVREDERFAHNDELDRLNIRSYAGAPLRAPSGEAIGSLCLTDDETRAYTDDERRYLRLLADEVVEQLDLRRRLRAAGGGSR